MRENEQLALVANDGQRAFVQLPAFIASENIVAGDQRPQAHELLDFPAVTRNDLRKALALLEAEDSI